MVMEGLQEDMGEGSMQCTDHPYKNNTPGGICAFCLQEKLGKLVSSSFPVVVFPSSSSSSPSFRSEFGSTTTTTTTTTTTSMSMPPRKNNPSSCSNIVNTNNECHYHQYYSKRSRILYLLSQKKKKKKDLNNMIDVADRNNMVFKRSKSTTIPRRGLHNFLGTGTDNVDDLSTHKRGFWSFLYLPKHSTTSSRKSLRDISSSNLGAFKEGSIVVEEKETPFDRKVSRSRSVGCGSRSFSGDFFERISTGFGDCTLRRVVSQREGESKVARQDCIKERVKCGGLFSGFMITSSSSSSYWVSTENNNVNNRKVTSESAPAGQMAHGRSKSWGWAFASPIRAFSKPSGKRESSNKSPTPNLAAIPSLLAVRS